MRLSVLVLSALSLCPALSALDDPSELKVQSDAHQMFLLRKAVRGHPQSSDFYAGEVACAFNDTSTCEEKFKKVLAAEPKSTAAKQMHHILAYTAMREGDTDDRCVRSMPYWL